MTSLVGETVHVAGMTHDKSEPRGAIYANRSKIGLPCPSRVT